MNHITHRQLQELQHELEMEKKDLTAHFDADAEDGGSLKDSSGELSSYDNHPGDLGTETFERNRDMAVDQLMEEKLEQVDSALEKMESGDYGVCKVCHKEIPLERLKAIPYTALCMEHASEEEAEHQGAAEGRPIEEEVMTPPPAGAGANRQKHAGRFDDADAWASAESYGNSDVSDTSEKQAVEDNDRLMSGIIDHPRQK
ncbi:TraR/DksA C4-type zinc finger protein [Paenibacillus solisilvae]|uniref:TraR/DksA C4-type zinc finger protein n=1 Tax=Paenibacillus solisilvae TaxID=2486751 RepID=A0ABW0VYW4_9BACL